MKSNALIAVLFLAACAFHPVPEDTDAGAGGGSDIGGDGGAGGGFATAGGGQGSVGGGNFGVGGGVDVGGGSSYGGGGNTGGGSGDAGSGGPGGALEIFVHQVDTTAGWASINFLSDSQYIPMENCGTHCVFATVPSTDLAIFANIGDHDAYATWDASGFPAYVGWGLRLNLTGHATTTVNVTITGHNLLFISSGQYPPGALGDGDGGVGLADALCNQDAVQRGYPGHYIAWLSTSSQGAAARVPPGLKGWVSAQYGTAPNFPDASIVSADEPWQPVFDDPAGCFVFWPPSDDALPIATGTTDWGTLASSNCNDWTSSDPGDTYVKGNSSSGIPGFSNAGTLTCDQPANLYCLETDHSASFGNPIATPLHTAFVTSGSYASGGGLAAFDQACTNEAAQANLAGTFKAMIATSAATASSRVVPDGNFWSYDLVDGMQISAWAPSRSTSPPTAGCWCPMTPRGRHFPRCSRPTPACGPERATTPHRATTPPASTGSRLRRRSAARRPAPSTAAGRTRAPAAISSFTCSACSWSRSHPASGHPLPFRETGYSR